MTNKNVVQQTKSNRCATMEIRWNENEDARTLYYYLLHWRASVFHAADMLLLDTGPPLGSFNHASAV